MAEKPLSMAMDTLFSRIPYVVLLVVASIIIKFINCGFTNCISGDGIYYLQYAHSFLEGNISDYLNAFIPPLYPLFVALFNFFVHHLEISGQIVSALAGTGMIILMYNIGKDFFGDRVGMLMGLMALISPLFNYYSSQVMTDMLYGLLYAWALYTGWRMAKNPAPKLVISFSILSAMSYYTRPEGLGLIIIIVVWFLYSAVSRQKEIHIRGVLSVSCAALLFLVLIFPQIYLIHEKTGEWTFSAKTSYVLRNLPAFTPQFPQIEEKQTAFMLEEAERELYSNEGGFVGFFIHQPFMVGKKALDNIVGYVGEIPKTMGFVLVIPFILGAFYRKKVPRKGKEELFAFFVIAFNIVALSLFKEKKRHLISMLPFLYLWCSIGFIELHHLIKKAFPQRKSWAIAAALSILVLATLPQTFRPIRKLGYSWYWGPEKLAGKWIKENIPPEEMRFLSWKGGKVMFYADADWYLDVSSDHNYSTIMDLAQKHNIHYFVMNNDSTIKDIRRNRKDFFNTVSENEMYLIKSIRQAHSKHEVLIYQFSAL